MTSAQHWVLVLVSVASLMVVLDMLFVTTALTTIRRDLGASIQELQWKITVSTLSFAILLMPMSATGDRRAIRPLAVIHDRDRAVHAGPAR